MVLKMKYCLKNAKVWTIKLVMINVIVAKKDFKGFYD